MGAGVCNEPRDELPYNVQDFRVINLLAFTTTDIMFRDCSMLMINDVLWHYLLITGMGNYSMGFTNYVFECNIFEPCSNQDIPVLLWIC